jgi:hypothetical protein
MTIINSYEIGKMDDNHGWYALKVGAKAGKCFRTKKAAIAYALANA